jgi:hypothetical protein
MDTVLSNEDGVLIYTGAPSATDEILAFHYGDFDDAYGDGTVGAAAANGRVYADTVPATLPTEFGSIGTPTTASGQTTYTWTPPPTSLQANVLLVAGGGGGGGVIGGGGGAGGVVYKTGETISGQQTIVVGQGGTGGIGWSSSNGHGKPGKDSVFGSYTSAKGGGGGHSYARTATANGGSGGGSAYQNATGGTSTQTDGYGNDGGDGSNGDIGAGGGGAGSVGEDIGASVGGNGGEGLYVGVFGEIYGESGWFAGGGGGGVRDGGGRINGTGGLGGGGDGTIVTTKAQDGTAHTGGGGGGGGYDGGTGDQIGADGGSGVVLVRYIVDTTVIMTRIDSMNFLPQLQGVSGAVVLTGVQQDTAKTFYNRDRGVLVASVTIDQSTQGIIYEGGGSAVGFVLYATGGTLYCQCGTSSVVAGSIELSWPIPASFNTSTPTEIGISAEVLTSTSRMRMFVNTQQVAQTSTTRGNSTGVAGSDLAGSGQVYNDFPVCRISSAQATYTDTIYTVNLYPNVYIE